MGLEIGIEWLSLLLFGSLGLLLLQSLSGGLVVLSGLSLFSTLTHAAVMSLFFVALSYLWYASLPTSRETLSQRPVGPVQPIGAAS